MAICYVQKNVRRGGDSIEIEFMLDGKRYTSETALITANVDGATESLSIEKIIENLFRDIKEG
jgi:hypothetical protein